MTSCVICGRATEHVVDLEPYCSRHAWQYMRQIVWPTYVFPEDDIEFEEVLASL